MGYITIAMIALTVIALLFGTLYGMGRGRNRSILRLILIIGSIVGAIFLRETVVKSILESNVGQELLISLGKGLPSDYQDITFILINIILNVVVYFVLFNVLRIVSWLIIFPILKVFVKEELEKKKGIGAIIGLVQGFVVAFAMLVPLSGLVIQVDRLSHIEMEMPQTAQEEQVKNDATLFNIPKEIGLEEYAKSGLCSIYNDIGGWYFDIITTVTIDNGELNFTDVCDAVVGISGVMSSASDIEQGFNVIQSQSYPEEEKAQVLKDLGASITKKGQEINIINGNAKQFLDNVIQSALGDKVQVNITMEDIKLESFGKAFTAIAEYYVDGEVSKAQAMDMVNGIVDNWNFIESAIGNGTLIDLEGANEQSMKDALEGVDQAKKSKIMRLFGIEA